MNITQEQLNNAVQEALKGVLGGLPAMQTQGNNITLKEFGAGFMKDKKDEISNTAYAKSDSLYRNHILPAFGEMQLSAIMRQDIQDFVNELAAEGYSMETMKAIKGLLSSILKTAAGDRLIPFNPCEAVKLPRMVRKKKAAPTKEQYLKLRAVSSSHRLWIAIPLLFIAGLRPGEMCYLTWEDIDFKTRHIHVHGTYSADNGKGYGYVKDTTKTESGMRFIPMGKELYKMLKAYRAKEGKGKTYVITLSREDRRMNPNTLRGKVFNVWRKKAGLPNSITPHSGRHYCASMLLRSGMNPETLRKITGHKDLSTLLDVYGYSETLSDEERAGMCNAFDKISA